MPSTATKPTKVEFYPKTIKDIDIIISISKSLYLNDHEENFEEAYRVEIINKSIISGTPTNRKNMPCPFSNCRAIFKGRTLFEIHLVSDHSDFPINFNFKITQTQLALKRRFKEFLSSSALQSYRKPFGNEGKLLKGGNKNFIAYCRTIGENILCPSFYSFESFKKIHPSLSTFLSFIIITDQQNSDFHMFLAFFLKNLYTRNFKRRSAPNRSKYQNS